MRRWDDQRNAKARSIVREFEEKFPHQRPEYPESYLSGALDEIEQLQTELKRKVLSKEELSFLLEFLDGTLGSMDEGPNRVALECIYGKLKNLSGLPET